jgi:hypothetical protein
MTVTITITNCIGWGVLINLFYYRTGEQSVFDKDEIASQARNDN